MKYLVYYDKDDSEGRNFCLAATNKINYIAKKISKEQHVTLVSASMSSNIGHFSKRKENINKNIDLQVFAAHRTTGFINKLIFMMSRNLTLFFYLFFNLKRNEKLLVYHALGYMRLLNLLKKIKKFKLILEVEEIYGDVGENKKITNRELKFFKKADGFIFPTNLLNDKVNVYNKPYCIIHGTYNVEKQIANKFDDGKIHCVYAGTFDPRKGGVAAAAAAAQYLTDRYHLHIIGFGTEEDKKLLIKTIEEVKEKTNCTVTYDGLKSGQDYIKFIQSCHIGLSTQNPNAAFNDTSFPSKVLSYLANGLRVVSVKIKALETSDVNDLLYYYEEQTPQEIAKAIMSIDVNDNYDSRKTIAELDIKFGKELKDILWI